MTEMAMDGNDQEVVGSHEMTQFIKGKRTRRWRPTSPMGLKMTSTSSSAGGSSTLSPRSSAEFAESTAGEEEEEMANFLILLARGHQAARKSSEHIVTDLSTSTSKQGRQWSNVYQCKTCNRCFPSFRALGGHRTSHKKPEPNIEGKKAEAGVIIEELEEDHQRHDGNIANTTLPLGMAEGSSLCGRNVKSNKVHECCFCGAKFSSGQALGGHMRRHKALTAATLPSTATTTTTTSLGRISPEGSQKSKKPRNSLQLDLNLPAPEADLRESKIPFAPEEKFLVFSAFCSG